MKHYSMDYSLIVVQNGHTKASGNLTGEEAEEEALFLIKCNQLPNRNTCPQNGSLFFKVRF